jgi:large subunit ribosomal protein L13
MTRQKTYHAKPEDVDRKWFVVDAAGQNLGRLATRVAQIILGKDKPEFTPGVDLGDYVVVVNARQIEVTGKKLGNKRYYRHSEYPGGLKSLTLEQQLEQRPEYVIESAVRGMLPRNRHARRVMRKLKVYAGSEHPHQGQQPEELNW